LYAHQKGANYCLEIQRQVKSKCEYCGYGVTVKDEKQHYCYQKMIYHLEKQNEELKEMLKQKDKMIEEKDKVLQQKDKVIEGKDKVIQEIALKSASTPTTITNNNTTTTTTTTTNNNKYEFLAPFHLTSEYIKKKVDESFTEEYFLKGQKGVASFTYENLLIDEDTGKQNYYCSDLSRKIFVYKKKQGGKVRKDFKSSNLTNLIATDIIDKSKCLYEDGMRKIRRSVKNDSEIFDKSLVYVNNMCDIKGMRINNNGFVLKLCGLVCNRSRSPFLMKDDDDDDDDDDELVYVIESMSSEEDEEDEDDEEDLSKYTKEYFESKEALIENFRESAMYETFKKQLEAEKAKYWKE
jgi:hypothetical protein